MQRNSKGQFASSANKLGKETLSQEKYVIIADTCHGPRGIVVRKISGCDNTGIPGAHFSPEYTTVCRVEAKEPHYMGVKKSELLLLTNI